MMYIQRNIHNKVAKHLNRKEYTIITGARQTGKTSLLRELYSSINNDNEKAFFISFENLEILQNINAHPENVFKYALRPESPDEKEETKSRIVIFIDEIQYADNPSNFLKYLFDKYQEKLKIVATGSSAFYIDSNFDDSLAGRKRLFTLRTLSFDEYLIFNDLNDLGQELNLLRQQRDYISTKKNELLDAFDQYIVFGGYPAVALEKDPDEKVELLRDIKNSFLKRDIEESGVNNQDAFLKLFTILADQIGNLMNKNELSNTIGIDNKTVDHYLHVLKKCFHIELVKPFSTNLRKELTKMPKVFLFDNGMRNALLNRFTSFSSREDKGALLENYVFSRIAENEEIENIRFWRTTDQHEIDFVVTSDFGTGKAFEVKLDSKTMKSKGIKKFRELYPDFKLQILTYQFADDALQVLKL